MLDEAEREARILQKLRHPNIVAFYGMTERVSDLCMRHARQT